MDCLQYFFYFFRFTDRIKFIIKNIPRNTYKIRVLVIDRINDFLCMNGSCIISEMSICQQDNFKRISIRDCFVYCDIIRRNFDFFRMKNPENADCNNKYAADCACQSKGKRRPNQENRNTYLKRSRPISATRIIIST